MRQFVIGDIHGCFEELKRLIASAAITPDDVLVSVGDLIDRGPESPAVVRFLRDRPNTHVVAGNHERKHIRGIFSYAQEITRLQFAADYDEAVEWMRTLPYYLELDDAIVVHAALLPGRALAEQPEEILCGSTSGEKELAALLRGRYWHEDWVGPKPIVFGHHVVDQPLVRPGAIYGLDTGVCHGGHLTALELPSFRLHSVRAREDHWTHVKRAWQSDVLAAKPWPNMAWSEIDEQLARFSDAKEPRTRAYVDALHAWRRSLDERFAAVLVAIQHEAARLAVEAGLDGREALARAHSLAKLLFQVFTGRLDLSSLRKQLHTPRRLDDVAVVLGFAPLVLPSPSPLGTG
jgi:serine/threonine protein phosphatase 1